MNVFSVEVVVLIVGVIMASFGVLMTFLSKGVERERIFLESEIKENIIERKSDTKRIELLERQIDVILNELTHINRKLDDILNNHIVKRIRK